MYRYSYHVSLIFATNIGKIDDITTVEFHHSSVDCSILSWYLNGHDFSTLQNNWIDICFEGMLRYRNLDVYSRDFKTNYQYICVFLVRIWSGHQLWLGCQSEWVNPLKSYLIPNLEKFLNIFSLWLIEENPLINFSLHHSCCNLIQIACIVYSSDDSKKWIDGSNPLVILHCLEIVHILQGYYYLLPLFWLGHIFVV